jgi:hypothetical protein
MPAWRPRALSVSEGAGCLQLLFGLLMLFAGLATLIIGASLGSLCSSNVGDALGFLFFLGLPGALLVVFGVALIRAGYRR